MVMEDTVIGDDKYLLRKDSVVIIANRALHFDKETWGETADISRANRFCGKVPGHAFRGFGGGLNLYPDQGFALAEVAALVAILVMKFDMVPVGENGWIEPGQNLNNMSVQGAGPDRKLLVKIVPRKDSRNIVEWSFEL
jgi:cytochrome P450